MAKKPKKATEVEVQMPAASVPSIEDQAEIDKANFVQRVNASHSAFMNIACECAANGQVFDKAKEHLDAARRIVLSYVNL